MGWKFELRDANIVAYLTRQWPEETLPPRTKGEDLVRFLGAMAYPSQSLISSDPTWPQRVSTAAKEASRRLDRKFHGESREDFVSPSVVNATLFELRKIFQRFDLYALVAASNRDDRATAFFRHVAYSSEHRALILMPDRGIEGEKSLDFFDPLPPVQLIAEHPENLPGVLFWTKTGEAAFVPIPEAEVLYHRLSMQLEHGEIYLATTLKAPDHRPPERRRRILHLSDLHFGTQDALDKEPLLETCLHSRRDQFDRIVITGDLFDDPISEDYRAFDRFRTSLRNFNPKDPILVPGNHEQRFFGNSLGRIGESYRQLANLRWERGVAIDDDLKCIFLCFNSAEEGDWARGKISDAQLRDVAIDLEIQQTRRAELEGYERIAVLHHHPFPYAEEEMPIQRGRRHLFRGNERFIHMEDSDRFLMWCAERRAPLILHGHKHLARHRSEIVTSTRMPPREITAVGCGTSLGVAGKPLSYDIVSWTPGAERWSASFFSDPGTGSGFHQDYITLYRGSSTDVA